MVDGSYRHSIFSFFVLLSKETLDYNSGTKSNERHKARMFPVVVCTKPNERHKARMFSVVVFPLGRMDTGCS